LDKNHVDFVVADFGADPQIVTELMGIAPTESWIAGDPIPNAPNATRKYSAWVLNSGLALDVHVDDQLVALLSLLIQRVDRVKTTVERFPCWIRCAIYYVDFTPGINLSETVIRDTAALGLSIDFDLYFLGDA